MRNPFFLALLLATLFAFVQNFAEGEASLLSALSRAPAQAEASWEITPEPAIATRKTE